MEKKIAFLMIFVLLFTFLLPACSGDETKGDTTKSGTTAVNGSDVTSTQSSTVTVPAGATVPGTTTAGAQSSTQNQAAGTTKPVTTTKPATTQEQSNVHTTKPWKDPGSGIVSMPVVNDIEKNPLAAYQKAAKEIHDKGVAGYTKKSWQSINGNVTLTDLPALSGTISTIISSFLTAEADATANVYAKGSADAKNNMPVSNCTSTYIRSVIWKKSGSNYIVEIILADQINPAKTEVQGIKLMSCDLIYRDDFANSILNDKTNNTVINSFSKGNFNYKNYKITATLTPAGKFVDIKHYSDVFVDATINTTSGTSDLSCKLSINAHYTSFKY